MGAAGAGCRWRSSATIDRGPSSSEHTMIIKSVSRSRDLGGGLHVRRLLPAASLRAVGPFVFMDHMGPAELVPPMRLGVRPHPHIGLATVTYLFEGALLHRDTLGNVQRIEP